MLSRIYYFVREEKNSPRCKQNNVITIGVALKESVSIECRVIANPSTNLLFEWRFNHQFARNRTDSEIYDKNIEDNLREDYSSVGRDHINHNEMQNNAIIDMPIPDDDHLQHFNEDSSKLDDNHHQLHNNRLDSIQLSTKESTITFTIDDLQSISIGKHRIPSSPSSSSFASNDYGYLYCLASNTVGKQIDPCIYHIIKAG
ncbi:hypothetical protein QR98_0043300 [Sarcoptes scabiei]|uniref:Ig-like domain-containing protein n=1 Tax=Sarcoptes scabiei TaxID=52283 RepID=A0A132A4F8_SARSC|nr:hypothetical protein QR98_0043300 [Sarcoptes scabiei]